MSPAHPHEFALLQLPAPIFCESMHRCYFLFSENILRDFAFLCTAVQRLFSVSQSKLNRCRCTIFDCYGLFSKGFRPVVKLETCLKLTGLKLEYGNRYIPISALVMNNLLSYFPRPSVFYMDKKIAIVVFFLKIVIMHEIKQYLLSLKNNCLR